MIRHHYTLEHIASTLTQEIGSARLIETFTQERNVCLLQFLRNNTVTTVSIDVADITGTVTIRPDTHRARKNSIDVFPMLYNQKCVLVSKHPNDRVLTFWFEHYQLHAQLFSGGSGNIIVTDNESGRIIDALHDKSKLRDTTPGASTYVPGPGSIYAKEAVYYDNIEQACRDSSTYYILRNDAGEVLFSLLPLHGYSIIEATPDLFSALRRAVAMRRSDDRTKSMTTELRKELMKRKARLEKGIEGMQSDAAMADKASTYRMLADLLISYPQKHQAGRSSLTVTDWNGVEQTVSLDSKLTIHENVQSFYTKARKSEKAKIEREQRLPSWIDQLHDVNAQLNNLESVQDINELEELYQRIFKRKYMQERRNTPPEPSETYRVFDLGDGYMLYVGKSAANNDQLTMKFAKQNDWWFHARGVSGSHAILRTPEGTSKPEKSKLERAAAISAYYSHARNASYTPVVYTQRKYVRKPKGAAVGAVTLERETVIMVKPEEF